MNTDRIKQFIRENKREIAISAVTAGVTLILVKRHVRANYIRYDHANAWIRQAYHPTAGDWLLAENKDKILQLYP